ncbi:MAG: hypothetical protein ACO2ON_01550 [Candidatus Nanopusillus sp.]
MNEIPAISTGDIRYYLLPEIIRLLSEVGNTSNLKVSVNYRVLDEEYLKKVRALITNVYLYVSSAKITDDESKRNLLNKILYELLNYDDYIRWGKVDYRILMSILSRIVWILNSVTGAYDVRANLYKEEFKPREKQIRKPRIL